MAAGRPMPIEFEQDVDADSVMPEFWKFVAGLGLFLLGMMFLENALRSLAGPSFKRFLRSHTRRPAEAILVGVLVTAVLQSSSLVTLMLLALTGAGVMRLQNALGVIIGANLGTTFTGWVVATLGFKLNLDTLALPLVGIGCMGIAFLPPGRRPHEWFTLAAGFGFLLLGLGFMKTSAEGLATWVDIRLLADFGLPVFLLFGFALTAVIQSSSACMMIVLAAVHAGIIDLPMAAAVVIGADLGTTMTTILGALRGNAVKRQVALAHVLFNVVTDVIAFLMIHPLLGLITQTLGITDPLYGTVAFHSMFNIIGIVLFFPLLGRFARFLERQFVKADRRAAVYLHQVPVEEVDTFLLAVRKDLVLLVGQVLRYNCQLLRLTVPQERPPQALDAERWPGNEKMYEHIKDLHGELLAGCLSLQEVPLNEAAGRAVSRHIVCSRAALHSAKSLKDVHQNLQLFEQSELHSIRDFLQGMRNELQPLYARAEEILLAASERLRKEDLLAMHEQVRTVYDRLWMSLSSIIRAGELGDIECATLSSLNRELYSANKALVEALDALAVPSASGPLPEGLRS